MEEKNINPSPFVSSPSDPRTVANPIDIKKEQPDKIPVSNFSSADPIKLSSPFAPPEAAAETAKPSPETKLGQTSSDFLSTLKKDMGGVSSEVKTETSSTSLDSAKTELVQEEKKSNTGFFIIIALILVIAASVVTGILVYAWQSKLIEPLQKEKALFQSQATNIETQMEVIQKEKNDLQAEINALKASLNKPAEVASPTAPPTNETQPAPMPEQTQAPMPTPPNPTPVPGQ